jgi:hypothetical protein
MLPPKSLKTIYVSDPKDPRIKAYNDKIKQYNYYKNLYENGAEVKKRNLKYENLPYKKGEQFYIKESSKPLYAIEKPRPVVYKKKDEMLPPKKNTVLKKVLAKDGTYDILRTNPGDDERKKKAQEEYKNRSAKVEEMKKAGQISDKQYKYLTTKNNELLELNSTNIDDNKFLERRSNFKTKYKENPGCSGYNCPPDENIPDEREIQRMELKRPELTAPTRRLEKIEVPSGPAYSQPSDTRKGTVVRLERGETKSRKGMGIKTNNRRINTTKYYSNPKVEVYRGVEKKKLIPSIVQKATGYDKKKMEGYENEEGMRVPGEIETARMEDRQIKFTGANSIKDLIRQRKYKKEYPKYEEGITSAKRYNSLVDAMNMTEKYTNK